jgi:hypothetical protein
MPWRPIGLWDVKDPTLSRQSAHRCRLGCQPYTPAALYTLKSSGTHVCYRLSKPRSRGAASKNLQKPWRYGITIQSPRLLVFVALAARCSCQAIWCLVMEEQMMFAGFVWSRTRPTGDNFLCLSNKHFQLASAQPILFQEPCICLRAMLPSSDITKCVVALSQMFAVSELWSRAAMQDAMLKY